MSTPGLEFREADYLGLDYLAITSAEVLDRLLLGQPIDSDDEHSLQRARQFLSDAVSGAKLATSGVPSNASPADMVRKFSYSLEPLSQGSRGAAVPDVTEILTNMVVTIEAALRGQDGVDQADLTFTRDFFRRLHKVFLNVVESGRRRTGADFTLGDSFTAHA